MHLEISPENEEYIRQMVANGEYRTQGQVLDEALELLKRRDLLRREVNAGVEQLERGEGLPGEQVFQRLQDKAENLARQVGRRDASAAWSSPPWPGRTCTTSSNTSPKTTRPLRSASYSSFGTNAGCLRNSPTGVARASLQHRNPSQLSCRELRDLLPSRK